MLNALELENFKAFGERARVEFAPITLIFGANSAGKSSILHCLSLLKQTRESRDSTALLSPRAEGGLVDLGSFHELIFDHDLDRSLHIRIEFDPSERRSPLRFWRMAGIEGQPIGFEARFQLPRHSRELELCDLQLFAGLPASRLMRFEPTELSQTERRELLRSAPVFWRARRPLRISEVRVARCAEITSDTRYWSSLYEEVQTKSQEIVEYLRHLQVDLRKPQHTSSPTLFDDEHAAQPERLQALDDAVHFYSELLTFENFIARMQRVESAAMIALDGFVPHQPLRSDPADAFPEFLMARRAGSRNLFRYDSAYVMTDTGRAIDDFLEALFPMGPFRRPPERWYIYTGTSPQDVGYRGDLLPDLLFRHPDLVRRTNEWLDRLEIGYHIEIRPVGTPSNDLFEVRLLDRRRSGTVDVALSDVGFGIGQLLPFIVQSLATRRQIITIEQPEVHVHPRLQADLGDLLAEAIREPQGHRFIIETHSEHLILRVQRLVRVGTLKPSDVSVIHVRRSADGARAERLHLDSDGEFVDEWPGGFFPERIREITG